MADQHPTLCFFGTYDPATPRNRLLLKVWQATGGAVIECRAEAWPAAGERALLPGRASWAQLAGRFLKAQASLWRQRESLRQASAILVPYPGHFDMPLARLLAWRYGKKLIFEPFISLYDTAVGDRRLFPESSIKARLLRLIDAWALRLADVVLADTQAHADYYSELAGLPASRFAVAPIGADEALFHPQPPAPHPQPFQVLFYGNMTPLHGVETIFQAAKLLEGKPGIRFLLVGEGQVDVAGLMAKYEPSNVSLQSSVPYEALPELIAQADVCLGIFGTSDKAARVVPHKVYEAAAMGKAIVTADTPAVREAFPEETLELVEPGDASALAEALRRSMERPEHRDAMGAAALAHFDSSYSTSTLGKLLVEQVAPQATSWGSDPEFFGPRHSERLALVAAAFQKTLPAPARVLDAGAGAGHLAQLLAARGYEVVGLDASEAFVAHAQARAASGEAYQVGDVTNLPFADATFDGVIASEVLEHVEDHEKAVSECLRVLRPGGVCVASVPSDPAAWDFSDEWAGHVRRYEDEELRALFAGQGFHVERLFHWGFPFVSLYHRFAYLPLLRRKVAQGDAPSRPLGGWKKGASWGLSQLFKLDRVFARWPRGIGALVVARK